MTRATTPQAGSRPTAATLVGEALRGLRVVTPQLDLAFWDGSSIPGSDPVGTLRFASPDALRRIVRAPNELGFARAYVAGELEVEGDLYATVKALRDIFYGAAPSPGRRMRSIPALVSAARTLGAGRSLTPPPEEARLRGWRHTLGRDRAAVTHHYDIGNDFYRLVLGESMTYSCARYVDLTVDPVVGLADAQVAKHELICRKLGLAERPGMRLLDVGCGWGSLAIHAAVHHGASVVGVTLSREQAALAGQRARAAAVQDRVDIRVQDYRRLDGEVFDAIASVGMSEHVGHRNLDRYYATLRAALRPGCRLLNHAISAPGGGKIDRNSFVGRYVFPDGELIDVGESVLAMERAGFEVRDVESLREHYARTLRAWVARLEASWDRAEELIGRRRARVWRLYMAGAAVGFDEGAMSLHQVLGVLPTADGASHMPATRRAWD